MAAGKFHFYTTFMKRLVTESCDMEADAWYAMLLTDGYSPSTASHSAYNNVSSFQASASSTIVNNIALSGLAITGSGNHTIKWDAADISGFSSDGSTITSAKYLVILHQTATANAIVAGFVNLNVDSGDASVGESTQVNITWPSGGIGKLISNP